MTRHEPERLAGEYLGGVMSARRARRFEGHLVDCEACWREVRLGERGRALATSGRELAPPHLRERVRASVEAAGAGDRPPRRRPAVRLAVALAGTLVVVAGILITLPRGEPPTIHAVMQDFTGESQLGSAAARTLPRRLGEMVLVEVRAGAAGERQVTVHRYRDAAGLQVAVYRSDRSFPIVDGARRHDGAWEATMHGATLFCTDDPVPTLIVGDDRGEVTAAVEHLGIDPT